jgi:hypothetical protein
MIKATNQKELLEVITQIHFDCYKLCKLSYGKYFTNASNMGVFCHFDDEYEVLIKLREELTLPSTNPNQKYFTLINPIVIPAEKDIPETIYNYLYIRKPDPSPYGKYIGDVDFYVGDDEYLKLVADVESGKINNGVKLYQQAGVGTFVQMTNPEISSVSYVSTKVLSEMVRVKYA